MEPVGEYAEVKAVALADAWDALETEMLRYVSDVRSATTRAEFMEHLETWERLQTVIAKFSRAHLQFTGWSSPIAASAAPPDSESTDCEEGAELSSAEAEIDDRDDTAVVAVSLISRQDFLVPASSDIAETLYSGFHEGNESSLDKLEPTGSLFFVCHPREHLDGSLIDRLDGAASEPAGDPLMDMLATLDGPVYRWSEVFHLDE